MKPLAVCSIVFLAVFTAVAQQPPAKDKQPQAKGKGMQAGYQPTADETQKMQAKFDELAKLLRELISTMSR